MSCGRYWELLSARLDGALTEAEERELEAHLASCPACRAAGAQLAALRSAFAGLEEIPAPGGFTRDVMGRVRGTDKAIPRFRRPRFKVLAGLAACAVLAAGLYGAVRPPRQDLDAAPHGFNQDALVGGGSPSAGGILRSVPGPSTAIAGSDADTPAGGAEVPLPGIQKTLPDETAAYSSPAAVPAAPVPGTEILVVDRMPEGGWELLSPEVPVPGEGLYVTAELLEQIQRMAQEQGIAASLTSGTEEAEQHLILVLEETG